MACIGSLQLPERLDQPWEMSRRTLTSIPRLSSGQQSHKPSFQAVSTTTATGTTTKISTMKATASALQTASDTTSSLLELHLPTAASLEEKERWLQAQLSTFSDSATTDPNEITVTREHFVLVLQDLANQASTVPGCAVRAERWLGRLERLAAAVAEKYNNHYNENHDDSNTDAALSSSSSSSSSLPVSVQALMPDATCYRLVIQAWADSNGEDPNIVVTRARRWLMKHVDSPNVDQRPDTESFNAFLNAVSKGRAHKGARAHSAVIEHAKLAQETLQSMVEDRKALGQVSRIAPDIDSFNYVIRAWTRCRRASEIADRTMEAMRSLEEYQKEYDSSVRPNTKSYGMVLDSLSCRASQKVRHCKDVQNSSLNGLDELDMIENVIQLMHQRGGEIAPTTYIYNIWITAWAHLARIHPQKATAAAERLLRVMIRHADQGDDSLRPDAKSYLLVMRAWRNTKLSHRASRAAWWLDTQWRAFEFDGHCRPTTESYNMVIRMLAESGATEKAEQYFIAMEENDHDVRRDSESFAYIIRAWISAAEESSDIRPLQRAVHWLDVAAELESQESSTGVKTSTEAYCSILGAARKCAPKFPWESVKLAADVFNKMEKSHHVVGPLEYTRLLQVGILSLSRAEQNSARTTFIEQLVEVCSDAGLVSGPLVRAVSNSPIYYDGWTLEESQRMTTKLFGEWPLPRSWSRNVNQKGYAPEPNDLRRTRFYELSSHDEDPYRQWK